MSSRMSSRRASSGYKCQCQHPHDTGIPRGGREPLQCPASTTGTQRKMAPRTPGGSTRGYAYGFRIFISALSTAIDEDSRCLDFYQIISDNMELLYDFIVKE